MNPYRVKLTLEPGEQHVVIALRNEATTRRRSR